MAKLSALQLLAQSGQTPGKISALELLNQEPPKRTSSIGQFSTDLDRPDPQPEQEGLFDKLLGYASKPFTYDFYEENPIVPQRPEEKGPIPAVAKQELAEPMFNILFPEKTPVHGAISGFGDVGTKVGGFIRGLGDKQAYPTDPSQGRADMQEYARPTESEYIAGLKYERNPFTPIEQQQQSRFDQLQGGGIMDNLRAISETGSGMAQRFGATIAELPSLLDVLANPEKFNMTQEEATNQTAKGLTDLPLSIAGKAGYLSRAALGEYGPDKIFNAIDDYLLRPEFITGEPTEEKRKRTAEEVVTDPIGSTAFAYELGPGLLSKLRPKAARIAPKQVQSPKAEGYVRSVEKPRYEAPKIERQEGQPLPGMEKLAKAEKGIEPVERGKPPEMTDAKVLEGPKEPWQMTKKEFESQPNIVYHGGKSEYRVSTDVGGRTTGNPTGRLGAFFTPSPKEAARYVSDFHGGKGVVSTAAVTLKSPYKMSFSDFGKLVEVDWKKLSYPEGISELNKRVDALKIKLAGEGYDGIIIGEAGKSRPQEVVAFDTKNIIQHRLAVEDAISQGKPVPPEVLADYPDLAKKYGKQVLEGPKEAPKTAEKPPTKKPPKIEPKPKNMLAKSDLTTKNFKTQMLDEIGGLPTTESGLLLNDATITIPGDGEFTFRAGADLAEFKRRVKRLSDKSRSTADVDQNQAVRDAYGRVVTGKIREKSLREGLADGTVTFEPAKPSGGEGALGSPASPTSKQMGLSMEGKGAVGRQDIVKHFEKGFGVPLRVGKFRQKALGIYKPKPEVIRTVEANDLSVISHEVGHHIEKKVYGGFGGKSKLKLSKDANAELMKLGKDLYGTRKPVAGYRSEGFAEFLANWMVTDKYKDVAPKFADYFENTFLKQNPEIAKTLLDGRELVRKWRKQGAIARVYANIDVGNRTQPLSFKDRVADAALRTRTLMVDDIATLEAVEKKIRGVKRLDPEKIDPLTSPTMLAQSAARTAAAKAKSMVLDGTFDFAGKQTGPSLKDVFAPVSRDMKEFLSYAYAKRAQELWKRDINPGVILEDANWVASKLERPEFKEAFKGWQTFNKNVMDYLVESGGMSRDAAQTIMDLNQAYIPLKRVVDNQASTGTGGKKLSDLSSPVKKIRGSGRQIKDPIQATIENTAAIISFADKTRVGRALADLSKYEGSGRWIEKVPAPTEARRFSLEDMKKALEDAGVDLKNADMSEVLTLYSNAGIYKGRDNIVSFFRDGKREFYQVDKNLYTSLKAMDDVHLNAAVDFFFGKPARSIRLGATGLNAGFGLITNPLRDAFTFGLQTEFTSGSPHLIAKGLAHRFGRNNNMNQLWKRTGADMSQFLGLDRKSLRRAVGEVLASGTKRKAMNVISHPIELLREGFSLTESAPRLAEFEGAYRRGEQIYGKGSAQASIMGNLASSDVTVNFRRAGSWGKIANQMIPFWNAAVQGVSKFYRFGKAHPAKAGIKGVAYLTVPAVALWNLNKDKDWYKDMAAWERYGFFNFEVGTNDDGSPVVVRLPKPFEWNAFATVPEMTLDYWYNKDPELIKSGLGYMAEQTSPIGLDKMPPLFTIGWELQSNYDHFRDRPIDPYWETKYKSPEERYSAWTTESAKWLGKQVGVSPRKIDFVLSATTGGLASSMVRAGEQVAGLKPEDKDIAANTPIAGRLFARTDNPEDRKSRKEYERNETLAKVKTLIREGKESKAKNLYNKWARLNPDFKIEKPYEYVLYDTRAYEARKAARAAAE